MSRKLKRLIREEDRTMAKIEDLQEHLKEIRAARRQEEDAEILKSIRGLKLEAWDLFNMLTGIQDGTVSMETRDPQEEDLTDEADGNAGENEEEEEGQEGILEKENSPDTQAEVLKDA